MIYIQQCQDKANEYKMKYRIINKNDLKFQPVLNHPSLSNDWDVTWGKFKYPRNTPGPYEVKNEK